jgi:hypothetical protein
MDEDLKALARVDPGAAAREYLRRQAERRRAKGKPHPLYPGGPVVVETETPVPSAPPYPPHGYPTMPTGPTLYVSSTMPMPQPPAPPAVPPPPPAPVPVLKSVFRDEQKWRRTRIPGLAGELTYGSLVDYPPPVREPGEDLEHYLYRLNFWMSSWGMSLPQSDREIIRARARYGWRDPVRGIRF